MRLSPSEFLTILMHLEGGPGGVQREEMRLHPAQRRMPNAALSVTNLTPKSCLSVASKPATHCFKSLAVAQVT